MQNRPFHDWHAEPDQPSEAIASPQNRLAWLSGLVVVITLIIGVRVSYVQAVIADRFITPWDQTTVVETTLPARNGRILSRDGVVLAFDQTQYDITVDYRWLEEPFDPVWLRRQVYQRLSPKLRTDQAAQEAVKQEILDQRETLFTDLAHLTSDSKENLQARAKRIQQRIEAMVTEVEARRSEQNQEPEALSLRGGLQGALDTIKSELTTPPRRYASDPIILKEELQPHSLIKNASLEVVAAIKSTPHRFQGVHVQSTSTRIYPLDDVAAHLIGLRKSAVDNQLTSPEGGIEQQYNDLLSGTPGRLIEQVNRRGEVVTSRIADNSHDGDDIVLNIDSRLQQTAEELLDAALADESAAPPPVGGVVIAMDLWTGDVLTAAAAPRVSLSLLLKPTHEQWQQLLDEPNQPLFPRATHMAIPPGSVFKIVTAAAALQQGETTPDELLECRGYLNSPNGHRCQIFRKYGLGHGEIQLKDALCQSCNVFFFDLAQRIGADPLVDWSRRFGFGETTGIDLPAEQVGLLPDPKDPQAKQEWYPGSTLQLSIGQGSLLATPLQVTRMMAAIGNGGYLVTPRIAQIRNDDNTQSDQHLTKIPDLNERTLATIRQGLEMVVHHPRGTGIAALTPSMTIAAKTGTAEVAGKPDHAWMAGYAPVESPRIAFCVVLEHGGSGGEVAGPIVKELLTEILGLGLLRPQWDDRSTQVIPDSDVPSVVAESR